MFPVKTFQNRTSVCFLDVLSNVLATWHSKVVSFDHWNIQIPEMNGFRILNRLQKAFKNWTPERQKHLKTRNIQQQYHVVHSRMCCVGLKWGFGRAWVVHVVGAWHVHGMVVVMLWWGVGFCVWFSNNGIIQKLVENVGCGQTCHLNGGLNTGLPFEKLTPKYW